MASLARGLVVLGIVCSLAGAAEATAAAPLSIVIVAQDEVPTDSSADSSPDASMDTPTAVPMDTPTAVPTDTPTPIPTTTPTPVPTVGPQVIQQVIQHDIDEQVQAVATRNMSLMSDTLTADQFQSLSNTLQDMLNHQTTAIALVKLDWGPITIAPDGSTATATTFETWRIVSQAASIDYDPVRNDYALVLDNGKWKIKSDVQVMSPH